MLNFGACVKNIHCIFSFNKSGVHPQINNKYKTMNQIQGENSKIRHSPTIYDHRAKGTFAAFKIAVKLVGTIWKPTEQIL